MALNHRQELFCQEYLVDLNATQAAKRAGYSAKTAEKIGCENLRKPDISSRIAELQEQRAQELRITQNDVLIMIRDCYEGAKEDRSWAAAIKSAELFGKHLGMFTEKVEHSGGVNIVWVEPKIPSENA